MQFEKLIIENFRNFKCVEIELTNRNIIFGLNDIGKTNLLSAIRFLLDKDLRRNGLLDSDFYNKNTDNVIKITLQVNINDDENDKDNKKIFSMMKGAIPSDAETVFFQLKADYSSENLKGIPELFWGVDINHLEEIPSSQSFYEIDKYFNVIYIDSAIQLENTFKKYSRDVFRNESSIEEKELKIINKHINSLNRSVSNLKSIKKLEKEILEEYKKFKKEKSFRISIQSEIELRNFHNKLTPYIQNGDKENYPTSGDGRKKIFAYTLLTLENRRKEERKINVFLIEELENHLHRSMQIALSYQIFSDEIFRYLFMTTHSSLIVSQMDEVNLIKLFKRDNVIVGESHIYLVPKEYKNLKQKLNQSLAEAIFADYVLLVEGPSEKVLFERILKEKCEKYESLGGYILEIDGINFSEYYKILDKLGIEVIVKTDNDLKVVNKSRGEYSLIGLNRCLKVIGDTEVCNVHGINPKKYEEEKEYKVQVKKNIYTDNLSLINNLRNKNIYLSRVDLENDLYEVIPDVMDNLAKSNRSSKNGVDYLQSAKLVNMIDLCQRLTKKNINAIYNNSNFKCLKVLVELCCQ